MLAAASIRTQREEEEREYEERMEAKASRGQTPLELCISSATWHNERWTGALGMHAAFQNGLRRRAAEFYARAYQKKYGRVTHENGGAKVFHGSGGIIPLRPA